MDDHRILDFSNLKTNPVIPDWFDKITSHNLMLAAGDGTSQFEGRDGCNLKTMPESGWNIFCCPKNYTGHLLQVNIDYLKSKPDLEILLCLVDFTEYVEFTRFTKVFKGKIDKISSHDGRFWLPSFNVYNLLKPGGICYVYETNNNRGQIVTPKGAEYNFEYTKKWDCQKIDASMPEITSDFLSNKTKCVKISSGGKKRRTNKRRNNKKRKTRSAFI